MLSKRKTQAWANVPVSLKQRLEALRKVDPVLFSESRVIWQCIEAHLPVIESDARSFNAPIQGALGRKKANA